MPSQPREDVVFDINIQRLEGLPQRSLIRIPGKRQWYVTLNLGAVSEKTQSESQGPDGVVTWGQTFTVTLAAGSKFTPNVVLWQAHKHSNDEKVAVASNPDLVEMSQKRGVSIELRDPADETKRHGRLFIDVRINLPNLKSPTSSIVTRNIKSPTQFAMVSPERQSWQPFLQAFRQAVEVARQISELDPTVKVALGAISFALTALVKQIERDQRVNELQEIMTLLLLFFSDVEPLQQSPFLRSVLDCLLRQVSECTYFILQYREIESFVERTAVHLTTDTDGILDRFYTTFTTLRAELALGASLQTTINTEYILNKINDIDVLLRIKSFQHLTGCSWRSDKQCGENTRDFTINRILRWVSSFQPSLFMLSGPVGAGKSCVLHRLADILDRRGRLGAGIFLNEFTKGEKTADSLMRTLLYYLASSHPALGEKIASAIAQHPSLDYADANRYSELLKEVTCDLVLYGPLVVIVDGLQELDTTRDQQLVQTILTRVAKSSHSHLRFIVASVAPVASMDIHDQNTDCMHWEIASLASQLTRAESFVQRSAPALADMGIFDRYERLHSADLIGQHPQKFGSIYWSSYACRLLIAAPCLWDALLKRPTPSLPFPFSPEEDDEDQIVAFAATVLDLTVLDSDFLSRVPGSRLFMQSHLPKHSLHLLGLIRRIRNPQIKILEEYEITIPRSLSEMMGPTNPPFLPVDFPLNIYELCLRNSSEDGLGPVYARIALPMGEPLVDGHQIESIEKGFYRYGVGVTGFREMKANSPTQGCQWIILHHKLFQSETKNGYASVMVTTPVITQAILQKLTCIWVYWDNWAEEGTCMQLRDGKENRGFLANDNYTKVVYDGTRSELLKARGKKGELRPGDRITVRAKYKQELTLKYAVIAMALKY